MRSTTGPVTHLLDDVQGIDDRRNVIANPTNGGRQETPDTHVAVGTDGNLWARNWNGAGTGAVPGGWGAWTNLGTPPNASLSAGAAVTAVAYSDQSVSPAVTRVAVVLIDNSGSSSRAWLGVVTPNLFQGTFGMPVWTQLITPTGAVFKANGPIAATVVNGYSNLVEVFAIDNQATPTLWNWGVLNGGPGTATLTGTAVSTAGGSLTGGAPVSATSRKAGHLDVAAIQHSGGNYQVWLASGDVQTTAPYPINSWTTQNPPMPALGSSFPATGYVTATTDPTATPNQNLYLFLVDTNQKVMEDWFNDSTQAWNSSTLQELPPSGTPLLTGQPVAANIVSPSAKTFEIDALDTSGNLWWGHAWAPASNTVSFWTKVAAGPTFSAVVVQSYAIPTTSTSPFTLAGGYLDAFGIDANGHLRTLWYWQNPS